MTNYGGVCLRRILLHRDILINFLINFFLYFLFYVFISVVFKNIHCFHILSLDSYILEKRLGMLRNCWTLLYNIYFQEFMPLTIAWCLIFYHKMQVYIHLVKWLLSRSNNLQYLIFIINLRFLVTHFFLYTSCFLCCHFKLFIIVSNILLFRLVFYELLFFLLLTLYIQFWIYDYC